jgi:hypothetical protein
MKTRTYSVTAQIVSGINDATVWEDRLAGKAANKQQAMAGAKRQVMDTVVEFDERIDPRIRIMAVAQDQETRV